MILLFSAMSTSSSLLAVDTDVDCESALCNKIVDYGAINEAIAEQTNTLAQSRTDSINNMVDTSMAPQQKGFGSSCLDGIMGLNVTGSFVDPTSPWPNIADAIKDQLLSAACSFVVTEANAKIAEVNNSINTFGSELSENTYGILDIESSTNTGGNFSYSEQAVSIQDSETLKLAEKKYNEEFQEKVLGGRSLPNSDLDLQDDSYYDESVDSTSTIKKIIDKDQLDNKFDSAMCRLLGSCEENEGEN